MRIAVSTAAILVSLAACSDGDQTQYANDAVDVEMISPASQSGSPSPNVSSPTTPAPPPSLAAPQVAYVYHYGLELPDDRAPVLLARHEQACVQAGAAVCQMIGSESTRMGGDAVSARLEIRATPAWLARFRSGLAGDAEAAGGKIVSASTESEDLTRNLIDTEARLRAQTTLRDRLQQLLATRTGDLEQLLKVESELARVQGEIDTVQSTLAVLRTRVAMSRLEIRYDSREAVAGEGVFAPLTAAVTGAFRMFIQSVAALVTILAFILPFVLLVVPLAWWGLKRRKATLKTRRPTPRDTPD